ncbi:MAG: GntR family transcriptional regulator [Jatrophihabitans sp.]
MADRHSIRLDRNSPVPLYFQVAQQLEQSIASGEITPGARLVNEVDLVHQLGLSRPTVRKAMEYLVDKGLVVRQRGVGTRVVSPKVRRSLNLSSLYDDLANAGQRPSTTVLINKVATGTPDVLQALGLGADEPVVRIVRLRNAGSQPIAKLTNYLPADRITISTEDLESDGLYELLRRSGINLHSATQVIGARPANAAEARVLGDRRGAALLTMQRTAFDDHGRAVEYGNHIYSAARYSFEMSMLAG